MSDDVTLKLHPIGIVYLRVLYKNWKGMITERDIVSREVVFGSTEWHTEPQWLMIAFCLNKRAMRTFAMKDFLEVRKLTKDEIQAASLTIV